MEPKNSIQCLFLFVWTLCFQGFPTLNFLFTSGRILNTNCLMCQYSIETWAVNYSLHLHYQGKFFFLIVLDSDGHNNLIGLRIVLWGWGSKKSSRRARLCGPVPFTISWNIWKERNNGYFNNNKGFFASYPCCGMYFVQLVAAYWCFKYISLSTINVIWMLSLTTNSWVLRFSCI